MIEVTADPLATSAAPQDEEPLARESGSSTMTNETVVIEGPEHVEGRATSYPITYHGGTVLTSPGTVIKAFDSVNQFY